MPHRCSSIYLAGASTPYEQARGKWAVRVPGQVGAEIRETRRGKRWGTELALLKDGEDVAGGVLEPGDVRAARPVDALVVLADAVVALEADAAAGELVHGRVDVVHLEVEDGVGGRLV